MPIFTLSRSKLDVSPADAGRRLAIRYRVGMRQETEIIGVLLRWSGGEKGMLRVRLRSGSIVGIRVKDIISMRVYPPEASAYTMQRLAEDSWPPIELAMLDNWCLRAGKGATSRSNSARVTGPPKSDLGEVLGKVKSWYDERELLPQLQIPSPSGFSAELREHNWEVRRSSNLMINSVSLLLEATTSGQSRSDLLVESTLEPDEEWLNFIPKYGADSSAEYRHALGPDLPKVFVYCRNSEGDLLGIGGALKLDIWCSNTLIAVSPVARRTGVATAVIRSLAEWAAEVGARHWILQFFANNSAVLNFAEDLGFTTHHCYDYWFPADADPGVASDV